MSVLDIIRQLQTQVVELRGRVQQFEARTPLVSQKPAPIFAITSNPATGSYPAANTNPNTYPIRFLDVTFTASQGSQSATNTIHDNTAKAVARNFHPLNTYVPVGTVVIVHWLHNRWHFSFGGDSGVVLFQLSASLNQGGTAAATITGGSADLLGTSITVHDFAGLVKNPVSSGGEGAAIKVAATESPAGDASQYKVIWAEQPSGGGGGGGTTLVVFQLDGTLSINGTASATIKIWNGTTYDSGSSITVHDRCSLKATAANGNWGIAASINGRYEVVEILDSYYGHHWAKGELYASLTATMATVAVKWKSSLLGTAPAGVTLNTEVTAKNLEDTNAAGTYLLTGANGATCRMWYNAATSEWWLDDVECTPTATAATVTMSLGSSPTTKAQTVVTGQTWVSAGDKLTATVQTPSGTDPDEMMLLDFKPIISNIVDGDGFTLTLYSTGAKGNYSVSVAKV